MRSIDLYTFGKLKTPGLRLACDHYKKLIQNWIQFEEIELKPLNVPDKSTATRKKIQEKEGEILLEKLDGAPFFIFDEGGKSFPTLGWSKQFKTWEDSGLHSLSFVIGSSLGFSADVRSNARGVFSLGPQTLSFELTRLVALEQFFRTLSVIKGHPYHNEGV